MTLTMDTKKVALAIAYREAAVADGWSIVPTYSTEGVNRAASLRKDGFHMMVISRINEGRKHEASVSIWGPDGLAIIPPDAYDWGAIQAGTRTCNNCKATDVDTQRYSFAGRCCADCIDAMRKTHEYPGWTS